MEGFRKAGHIYNVHYVDYNITNSDYANMFNALYIDRFNGLVIGIGLYQMPYIGYQNIG